jgi:hypothetical protein
MCCVYGLRAGGQVPRFLLDIVSVQLIIRALAYTSLPVGIVWRMWCPLACAVCPGVHMCALGTVKHGMTWYALCLAGAWHACLS